VRRRAAVRVMLRVVVRVRRRAAVRVRQRGAALRAAVREVVMAGMAGVRAAEAMAGGMVVVPDCSAVCAAALVAARAEAWALLLGNMGEVWAAAPVVRWARVKAAVVKAAAWVAAMVAEERAAWREAAARQR